jgi:hypothetical protein
MSLLRQTTKCAILLVIAAAYGHAQPTPWDKPAAELARRIADQLGPSSAHLTLRNISAISADSLPVIRRQLAEDLKSAGVTITSGDSANAVRVTLSENGRGGLWIAEIVEGNQTRVVMVSLDRAPQPGPAAAQKVTLHLQPIAAASALLNSGGAQPILSVVPVSGALAVLFPSRLSLFENTPQGWAERAHADFPASRVLSRDPRGILEPLSDGSGFNAFSAGIACSGQSAPAAAQPTAWNLHCHPSDDPWPLLPAGPTGTLKAFYNAARHYFTGAVSPSPGVDLPPFYSAGLLPDRPAGQALLVGGVDGKVLLAEHGELKSVAGTRDWGSDFAVVTSECAATAQVIVSSSGEGKSDSLRSYEIPAQEALAVSEPLMLPGAAVALWPAPDGKSALAVIRKSAGDSQSYDYEVDRVTETCN